MTSAIRCLRPWLVVAVGLAAAGCGDDEGLRDTFQPQQEPEPREPENKSPIRVGTKLQYDLTQTYVVDVAQDSGSGDEYQTVGKLCIRADEVRDTVLEAHQNASQTIVVGQAHVTGVADGDIYYDGSSAEAVDADHAGLWLDALTPETRGHGLLDPTTLEFTTRTPPTPPEQSLGNLPFFEARSLDTWGGWDGEAEDTFLTLLTRHFADVLGAEQLSDTAQFRFNATSTVGTCSNKSESECLNECTWNGAECLGTYEVEVYWRHTLTAAGDTPLHGEDVVHQLRLQYTAAGILDEAQEYIVPDVSPESSLSEFIDQDLFGNQGIACLDSGEHSKGCIHAQVFRYPWEDSATPCAF
mgnify:CR=1 FL=1